MATNTDPDPTIAWIAKEINIMAQKQHLPLLVMVNGDMIFCDAFRAVISVDKKDGHSFVIVTVERNKNNNWVKDGCFNYDDIKGITSRCLKIFKQKNR